MNDRNPLQRANTLADAASPYLRQHAENPVHWHEWSEELIAAAKEDGRPLFVSVGYATCHWCHVMAREAFSDEAVAAVLNEQFICIKIDREERPDIDHFLMQFLLATRGHGGWPLNAFLTPELKPMLALTYMPVSARGTMPGFTDILARVTEFFAEHGEQLPPFDLWQAHEKRSAQDDGAEGKVTRQHAAGGEASGGEASVGEAPAPGAALTPEAFLHRVDNLVRRADHDWGGFGLDAKFPPHNSLLYLMHGIAIYHHEAAARFVRRTLDVMARRGLHDHVGGGFFRYCVDRDWTIPHFEKMLYDQAMLLWVYATAFQLFGDQQYREVALGIVHSLETTFRLPSGAYASAHDADTDHHEGLTYVWSGDELAEHLGESLHDAFELPPGGNFEGAYHLVRVDRAVDATALRDALKRMETVRAERPQPERDEKVVTTWNALAATALHIAARWLDEPALGEIGERVYRALIDTNRLPDGRWIRSSLDGRQTEAEFLEDYASVLLLETVRAESLAPGVANEGEMERTFTQLETAIDRFATERGWCSALARDFPPIPADDFDSPTPSPVSLVALAVQRAAVMTGRVRPAPPLRPELYGDAGNLAAMIAAGEIYLLAAPAAPSWKTIPINAIYHRSESVSWCFRGVCYPEARPPVWNPSKTL